MNAIIEWMTKLTARRWLIWAVVAVGWIVFASWVHADYGLSWDEPIEGDRASTMWAYVTGRSESFLSDADRYYGCIFRWVVIALDHLFVFESAQQTYQARHLANACLYGVGLVAFMGLAWNRWKSRRVALLAGVLYLACPRLFADGFYNGKDIPYLVAMIGATWTLDRAARAGTWTWTAIHAAASAVAVATRIGGVMIVAISVVVIPVALWSLGKGGWGRWALRVVGYLGVTLAVLVGLWPLLWAGNPLRTLVAAVQNMSHFPWQSLVLYQGRLLKSTELPWHYLPVWMGITIPIPIVLSAVMGLGVAVRDGFRAGRARLVTVTTDATMGALLGGSLFLVLVLHPVMYDGWRHFYYLYGPVAWFALRGWLGLWEGLPTIRTRWAAGWAGASMLCWIGGTMIALHPYQNLYFNVLAGPSATLRERYELDYWGLSYLEVLKWISADSGSRPVRIAVANNVARYNALLLPPKDESKIQFVCDLSRADYFIGNFRGHPGPYSPLPPHYRVLVDGMEVAVVYRLHH